MNLDSMEFILDIIFPKRVKDGAYVINLDECADVGTHWIGLYVKNIEIIFFDGFGVEHVPEEIKQFIGYKNIKTNIFRIQENNLIICGGKICLQAKI